MQEQFDDVYKDVLLALARHRIFLINEGQLNGSQISWSSSYFNNKVLCYISPIIIGDDTDLGKLIKDDFTYLVVELLGGKNIQYAAIAVPADDVPRFIELPREKGKASKNIILLDNVIRDNLNKIFKNLFDYKKCNVYSMKMTRDAEFGKEIGSGLAMQYHHAPAGLEEKGLPFDLWSKN